MIKITLKELREKVNNMPESMDDYPVIVEGNSGTGRSTTNISGKWFKVDLSVVSCNIYPLGTSSTYLGMTEDEYDSSIKNRCVLVMV